MVNFVKTHFYLQLTEIPTKRARNITR